MLERLDQNMVKDNLYFYELLLVLFYHDYKHLNNLYKWQNTLVVELYLLLLKFLLLK